MVSPWLGADGSAPSGAAGSAHRQLVEHELMLAHRHDIALLQRVTAYTRAVDERAIRALQVLHNKLVAVAEDAGMMARDGRVVDHDAVVG